MLRLPLPEIDRHCHAPARAGVALPILESLKERPMAKNRNTFEKHRREAEKKQRMQSKRQKRELRKSNPERRNRPTEESTSEQTAGDKI
jgi:hypothetical protein